ncbi:MAG: ArsB/NhaD family transporter [Sulfobacillus sp.]
MLIPALSLLLFLAVVVASVLRPWRLSPGWFAGAGAVVAVAAGFTAVHSLPAVWSLIWDPTLAFVAAIVMSLVLDQIGVFAWAARHVLRSARGHTALAFGGLLLLTAAVSMLFNNDGAALIMTPIALELAALYALGPGPAMALLLAVGFMVDAASLPLPVSNLVNILATDAAHISFLAFAQTMMPVDVAVVAVSVVLSWALLGRRLPEDVAAQIPDPAAALPDLTLFRRALLLMAGLVVAYVASGAHPFPVSVPASVAAILLVAMAWRRGRLRPKALLAAGPWQVVVFSVGMYVLVFALAQSGWLGSLQAVLAWASRLPPAAGVFAVGLITATLAAVLNNLPAIMAVMLSLGHLALSHPASLSLTAAATIGADIGPKVSPIGSLATLIWLHRLERHGISINWRTYVGVGVILTVPVLLVALTTLASIPG